MPEQPLLSAVKVYLALRDELAADPAIISAGINCLNESHFSDTTPCLAWMMLYEEGRLIWGCEADTLSMATKYTVSYTHLDVYKRQIWSAPSPTRRWARRWWPPGCR